MPITRTAIIDDDGSGKTGTVIDNAWKQELYNQIDGLETAGGGPWTAVPYASANFVTDGAGTNWYVPGVAANLVQKYSVRGKTVTLQLKIFNSHLYVASYYLGVKWPPLVFKEPGAGQDWLPAISSHTAATGWGLVLVGVGAGGQYLDFRRTNFSNWPVTGDDFTLNCNLTLELA